jgi:hypothetical protein
MDKFDMMLKAVVGEEDTSRSKPKTNILGSRIGEVRNLAIQYAVDKEEYPEIHYEKGVDPAQRKEDAVALLYAAGKIFEELTGAEPGQIGNELATAATKVLVLKAFQELMEDLKDE